MGACKCVYVNVWVSVALQKLVTSKPRALAAHNYVLLQWIQITELEQAFSTVPRTWGWHLLSNLENIMVLL